MNIIEWARFIARPAPLPNNDEWMNLIMQKLQRLLILIVAFSLSGCQVSPSFYYRYLSSKRAPPAARSVEKHHFSSKKAPPAARSVEKQRLSSKRAPPAAKSVEKHHFSLTPEQNVIGGLAKIRARDNDTLPDIARHFGLGYDDIIIANPHLDPWLLKSGESVLLPMQFILPDADRSGIILNLSSMRLFHFENSHVTTYPIGVGRDDWGTPKGLTKVISKTKDPVWRVPASILREHAQMGDPLPRVVPAGKENPLGEYAMRLSIPSYLIHGTNKPYGVGMQVTHGCIRLYPENIEPLFQATDVGTPVKIIDQPYLLAWHQGALYLEAHKPINKTNKLKKTLEKRANELVEKHQTEIDWQKVETVLERANGIPTPVSLHSPGLQQLVNQAVPVRHPDYFYQQPQPGPLTADGWKVTIPAFNSQQAAKKLVVMFNHLGPSIPARTIRTDEGYQIVTGPFSTQKEARAIQKRILRDFRLESKIEPPLTQSTSR